ncbi:MAG: DUF1566 domain-containing protein [Nitrospinae bacterium]|nr:DUF1566 domain-containing protein [Nitrospinota bacterium]
MKPVRHTLTTGLSALVFAIGMAGPAQAILMDIGGGIIFDDDTKLSWLKNANTAATNTFGVGGINANGTMNWSTANDWTAAMNTVNYLGFTDWRLPTTLDPDSSCTDDSAGAIPSTDTRGFNCTGS